MRSQSSSCPVFVRDQSRLTSSKTFPESRISDGCAHLRNFHPMNSIRTSALRRSLLMVGGLVLAAAVVISAAFVAGRMRRARAPGGAFVSLMIEGRNFFEN